MGGVVFRREYVWWNIRKDWMPLRNVRGLLRTQAGTSNIPTQDTGGLSEVQPPRYVIAKSWLQTPSQFLPKGYLESDTKRANGAKCGRKPLGGGISDNLTDEQETEIAENIYDWWISGKSYKQWYAEKFQQQDLFDKTLTTTK